MKLDAARELFKEGFWEDSASRAYYAMFHAARAALEELGVNPRTHKGTVSEFGRRLVLNGTFPREMGRALAEAKAARETYEYSAVVQMGREEAEALLKDAEGFVARINSHLQPTRQRQKVSNSLFGMAKGSKPHTHEPEEEHAL